MEEGVVAEEEVVGEEEAEGLLANLLGHEQE